MKILVADDNDNDRLVLRYLVESRGHEFIAATDGLEAIHAASVAKPDLVISDVLMPCMDGFQFLMALKQDAALSSIPFIFYSAVYRGWQDVRLAVSLGADGYIIKPKEPLELWEEVEQVMAKAKEKPRVSGPVAEDVERLREYSRVVAAKLEEKVSELERALAERGSSEAALRESEEKYRNIFEDSFDGLFITSPAGKILDMNKRCVAMFGYDTKEEMLRLDLERDVYAYPPDRARILAVVDAHGDAEYEVIVRKKSGEEMIAQCALTAVKNENGLITSYRGIIRDITERRSLEAELLNMEDGWRRRVGHELHDGLGQLLSGLSFMSVSLEDRLAEQSTTQPATLAIAHEMTELLDKAKAEMKAIVTGFAPEVSSGTGLVSLLGVLSSRCRSLFGAECFLTAQSDLPDMPPVTVSHLCRIAQEAVTNAVRHGKAGNIHISAGMSDGNFDLCVDDDGSGFGGNIDTAPGMGLKIMRYRARMIGAELSICDSRFGGARILCRLPAGRIRPVASLAEEPGA
ncbi:MAG: response regulator [Nitrospirae bacterium]|nr:response regulator [Nitrospirota bacterium]